MSMSQNFLVQPCSMLRLWESGNVLRRTDQLQLLLSVSPRCSVTQVYASSYYTSRSNLARRLFKTPFDADRDGFQVGYSLMGTKCLRDKLTPSPSRQPFRWIQVNLNVVAARPEAKSQKLPSPHVSSAPFRLTTSTLCSRQSATDTWHQSVLNRQHCLLTHVWSS